MTREWLVARYGIEALERYARMERALPVCLAGDRFVASHAEPARGYALGAILNEEWLHREYAERDLAVLAAR